MGYASRNCKRKLICGYVEDLVKIKLRKPFESVGEIKAQD